MKIQKVIDALEQFAPLPLQEDYDNAGLQVGLTEVEVSGALLCLDVTEAIIDEAVEKNCNLVVSHHPLIFHKLHRISDEDAVQRTVRKALEHHVTVVSMHTNMDAVEGGVNYKIAEKLGLRDLHFIGKRQTVEVKSLSDDNMPVCKRHGGEGVIGEFPEMVAADDLVLMLRQRFEVECVQCNQLLRREIRKVALCGGAGSFLLDEAIHAGADAFITGEMHYHEFFGHDQQIQICVIGHYQSEQYTKEIFRQIIEDKCPGVRCCLSELNTNPILYFS
ncbi:MAG: Nif3-like dinuclear metal center hexameric protein [Prevotella sp.]|nr:Nif3-like dinuclear metal center hexameric protein [Prevotella sp.]MCH3995645.1 Nif3-like dinuclear metal center hexameric protein [Prevotella sp.]